jgi:hypothetical protein
MMETQAKDANSQQVPSLMDAAQIARSRKLLARLPVTMRPALNQQLNKWESLFPYEQDQVATFLRGLEAMQPAQLESLIEPLKSVEVKMGVAQWNFSQDRDTMENASLLARSAYYPEWRKEVQRVYESANAAGRSEAGSQLDPTRLILIVLPKELPVSPLSEWKSWDPRAREIKINGDSSSLSELIIKGEPDRPGLARHLIGQTGTNASDLWLIDAQAELNRLLLPTERQNVCSLNYATLKPFRDRFLGQVNTVPKSIEGTDQTLDTLRHADWEQWWPEELAGQTRLRHFVIDLFLSGNGAMIFSNAFVEWAASEALRRARPRVIVARFGLRSKPKPFTGIAVFENQQRISALPDVDDPQGSAVDALMLARYIWLAALRYPQQERTACLCVSEYRDAAYCIAPESEATPWGTASTATPEEISSWIRKRFVS